VSPLFFLVKLLDCPLKREHSSFVPHWFFAVLVAIISSRVMTIIVVDTKMVMVVVVGKIPVKN
jgi:hypothetical protein